MNNEPVAWMYKDEENAMVSFRRDTLPFDAVPLYTHPAKTLTDEEIDRVWYEDCNNSDSLIEFARAILQRAYEK